MKKIFLVLPVAILLFISIGCEQDSTTSSSKSIYTNVIRKPDTLIINFNVFGTTYTFAQSDSNLQFSQAPKLICNVSMTSGSGFFKLYDANHELFYFKEFSQYLYDTLTLPYIPWKYEYSINNFTGNGGIQAIKNN